MRNKADLEYKAQNSNFIALFEYALFLFLRVHLY